MLGAHTRIRCEQLQCCRYTLPEAKARPLIQSVDTAWRKSVTALESLHSALHDLEAKSAKVLISRGAVPPTMQARIEEKRTQCAAIL